MAAITGKREDVARRRAELLSQTKLTVSEAMELMTVDRHTIYKRIEEGKLRAEKWGNKWYLDTDQFR